MKRFHSLSTISVWPSLLGVARSERAADVSSNKNVQNVMENSRVELIPQAHIMVCECAFRDRHQNDGNRIKWRRNKSIRKKNKIVGSLK